MTAVLDAPWREFALCRGEDTNKFFPAKPDFRARAAAMRICRECPVIDPCRAYAIPNEPFGIWGGTNERQRRNARVAAARSNP